MRISGVLFAIWMASAFYTISRIGPFPPRATVPALFIGAVLFAAWGTAISRRFEHGSRFNIVLCLAGLAVITPMALGTWVPGIKQLTVYPIPGAPTLVISARPRDNFELWMLHGGTANSHTRLTDTPAVTEGWPDLSPDGRQIVYASDVSGDYDIWLMTLDAAGRPTGTRRIVSGYRDDEQPVWSPDGKTVLFSSLNSPTDIIETYDMATGNTKQLTDSSGNDYDPAWSPDGKQIVYTSESAQGDSEIWLMNADGSNQHALITGNHTAYGPEWSPDGRLILFTAKSALGQKHVYLADSGGTAVRDITPTSQDEDEGFGWTPTGLPMFISDRSHTGGHFLYVCNLDGSNVRLVSIL